jgi:hypothetical protein
VISFTLLPLYPFDEIAEEDVEIIKCYIFISNDMVVCLFENTNGRFPYRADMTNNPPPLHKHTHTRTIYSQRYSTRVTLVAYGLQTGFILPLRMLPIPQNALSLCFPYNRRRLFFEKRIFYGKWLVNLYI